MLHMPTHTSIARPTYWAASFSNLIHPEGGGCSVDQNFVTPSTNDTDKPRKPKLHTRSMVFSEFLSGFSVGRKWPCDCKFYSKHQVTEYL
jgi:hypothetical protein